MQRSGLCEPLDELEGVYTAFTLPGATLGNPLLSSVASLNTQLGDPADRRRSDCRVR